MPVFIDHNSVVNFIISGSILFWPLVIISHSDKNKLFFIYLAECNTALGLENLRIKDSQLSAHSYYQSLSAGAGIAVETHPRCARLNNNYCAWCGPRGNGQYIQVDLRQDFTLTGIATQGFEALSDYYVRRYNVSHSRDGYTWSIFPVSINLSFCDINNNNDGDDNIYSDINWW